MTPDAVQQKVEPPILACGFVSKRRAGRKMEEHFEPFFLLSLEWTGQDILFSWLALSMGRFCLALLVDRAFVC
jgi:hypothetical protein